MAKHEPSALWPPRPGPGALTRAEHAQQLDAREPAPDEPHLRAVRAPSGRRPRAAAAAAAAALALLQPRLPAALGAGRVAGAAQSPSTAGPGRRRQGCARRGEARRRRAGARARRSGRSPLDSGPALQPAGGGEGAASLHAGEEVQRSPRGTCGGQPRLRGHLGPSLTRPSLGCLAVGTGRHCPGISAGAAATRAGDASPQRCLPWLA